MNQQENQEQQTHPEPDHNESANSSAEYNINSTHDEANNDSLEGHGADDECEDNTPTRGENSEKRANMDIAIANRSLDTQELSQEAGFEIKPDGKSNKYPLLKVYYEFGPWVGRNRKAICVRCKHTSASSQPERLIRHLRKCSALTDEDRRVAEELLLVSNANKKKRSSQANDDEETDYYDGEDSNNKSKADISRIIALPSGGPKRVRRDHPERKKHIDQCLVRFIICNRIPLKSVHSKEFVELVRSLDPDYRLPSRDTITNTLIPGLLNI